MDTKKKKKKGFFSKAKEEIEAGLMQVADDIHYIAGTKRGKMIEESMAEDAKYPFRPKKYSGGGEAKVKGADMDKKKTKSSEMTFAEKVAADNRDEGRKAEARAAKERAAATTTKAKSFQNGGMVKDSSSGSTRGVGKARKQTFRIY